MAKYFIMALGGAMDTSATGEMSDLVVLVDGEGRDSGTATKLSVHVEGKLHRAVSVFVFDAAGNMLLQRRAAAKYHSAGLWSNTCCGHPRPGESPEEAAHRRLWEEMGFDCPLVPVLSFVYRSKLRNGLIEHEHDHVFVGRFDGTPVPNRQEVADWHWVAADELLADTMVRPRRYTAWFTIALARLLGRGATEPGLRLAG
jgi:isopentenyl-diphosphate delta-isomerase